MTRDALYNTIVELDKVKETNITLLDALAKILVFAPKNVTANLTKISTIATEAIRKADPTKVTDEEIMAFEVEELI